MSYQIKRRDQFLATTAILGSMSLFATDARAACTESFAGSGVWDCTGANISTQSPTSATGGALDVSTSSAISTITPAGNALNLTNAIGDTDISFLDVFTSTITGNDNGIYSINNGTGNTSLITDANITGSTLDGVFVDNTSTGSAIAITTNGTVLGDDRGIRANNDGSGTTSVATTGTVTGTTQEGIWVKNNGISTSLSVNAGAGAVLGKTYGVFADNDGIGATSVTTVGSITGTDNDGVYAFNSASATDITVNSGAGTITGNTQGIHTNSLSAGDISISTIGTVVGTTEHGVYVDHDGSGSSSVNVMGAVMAAKNAIYAAHSSSASNISVSSGAGNISGGLSGIAAENMGTGSTQVTTGGGTVTGVTDHGVYASTQGTDVVINTGSGTVTGNKNAIYADNSGSGSTQITTVGDVTATSGSGISAENAGTNLNIDVNSGTVSGATNGIHAKNTGPGITTINNAGTVSGGTNSILIDSGSTRVNNAGILNGNVLFNSGDDILTLADGSTFNSDAVGGAGDDELNVTGDHTLGTITEFEKVNISNGTVSWNSTTSNVGALTLNNANLSFGGTAGSVSLDTNSMLSGVGSFDDLFVSGVISPGNSAGTINVAGNYTMEDTAVYHVEIFADGSGDLINVAGTVALSGKLEIEIADDPEEYDIKGIYTVLSADGPITGNFRTITSENTSTTLYVMHHIRNNNVEIDFIDPTEYFAPAGETSNQKAASVILPYLAISSVEAEKLFHAGDAEINEKLEELGGNRHATIAGIIASDGTEYLKTVTSQIGTVNQGNVNTWMKSYGLDSSAKTDGNARGYNHVSKGIALGFGLGVLDSITVGVHGGMTWSDATFGADKGEGRTKEAGAYVVGDFNILKIAAAYSHGWHDVKMSRFLNLLGTAQNTSNTKSNKYEFEASIPLRINKVTIEPVGGINHTKVNNISINETGVSIGNLKGTTAKFVSTQVHGGLRLSAHLPVGQSGVITPSAQVKYAREIGDLNGIMTAAFEAVPTTDITSRGITIDKERIEVDAGINFKTSGNLSFNLGYRGVYARNLKSHGGRVGFSLVF